MFVKEGFLAVHTKDGGEKTVRLSAKAAQVVDLLTGEILARDADSFSVRFASPDTRLFGIGRQVRCDANEEAKKMTETMPMILQLSLFENDLLFTW